MSHSLQLTDLTASDIWALEVRVEENVEVEGRLLAGVVDADVEVELLLPQDDPVGDAELVLGRREARERSSLLHQQLKHSNHQKCSTATTIKKNAYTIK